MKETTSWHPLTRCLNEVRPRRPEQFVANRDEVRVKLLVSMKSGLEGRNNPSPSPAATTAPTSLNEVRPRRPEQSGRAREMEERSRRSQ